MTVRFNLFTLIHKGLRHALQEMVWTAGRLDISDLRQRKHFFDEFKRVTAMLHNHAESEDAYIQPLIEQYAAEAGKLTEMQHRHSDELLGRLEQSANELAGTGPITQIVWQSFLDELNRFVGDYYLHLYHEEAVVMPLLWKAVDDEVLVGLSLKIRAAVPQPIQADFQRYMIPALNIQEQTMMLANIMKSSPEPVFQEMCRLFESLLKPNEWDIVQERLKTAVGDNMIRTT